LRGGAEVARWAHNPKVIGSNPVPATKKSREIYSGFFNLNINSGLISAAADIGSNPVPATMKAEVFPWPFYFTLVTSVIMYFVYILYSEKFHNTYTGQTSNLEQRLLSHNELSGKDWTKSYRPWYVA
jgi:hypothetical protein